MFTNIEEAVNWITSKRKGDNLFSSFKDVMNELGNPQNNFYTIHVAGTDGKGSTVTYLRDLLMSYGFCVGTLQSPHYLVHQDRIRVNNINIEDNSFIELLNKHYDLFCEKKLGMFEMDYIIMCDYFKQKNVDVAIIETGIGGRLDSTNVVDNPFLSIITTIGYDHMDKLGNTLEEICVEKCGIIKQNSKVLVGDLSDNLKEIVRKIAKERNTEYYELGNYADAGEKKFSYKGNEYEISSYAKYQYHNASLAYDAFELIAKDKGLTIDVDKAKESIKKTVWNGRFELIKTNPNIILDGAHNVHGVEALVNSFDYMKGSKLIIFSALKRKEYFKMCEMLKEHSDKLIVTSFNSYDAIGLDDIKGVETTSDYIKTIKENMNHYDNILICGSLYFITEVVTKISSIIE